MVSSNFFSLVWRVKSAEIEKLIHISAVIIKSVKYAIFVIFQESQKTEKSLSAVVALKDETNRNKWYVFKQLFMFFSVLQIKFKCSL